jgi:hypothetical protein
VVFLFVGDQFCLLDFFVIASTGKVRGNPEYPAAQRKSGLLRRFAPRNDGGKTTSPLRVGSGLGE